GWQGRKEKTVVVYLALHGGVERDGPFFWIDAPNGPDGPIRLPLRTVFASLTKLPADTQKLLILDPALVSVNVTQGMLHNDFVGALVKLEPEIQKIPNLVVLCSADVDQRSWVSEEWQQSIFGHYFLAGMRGCAMQGKGNTRLTAGNLYEDVRDRVEKGGETNRHRKQTPILLPRAAAMALAGKMELGAVPQQPDPKPAPPPGARFRVSDELESVWNQTEKLNQLVPSPAVYGPQRWREYRELSLRYEQVVRLGDPRAKAPVLLRRLNDLEREMRQAHGLNLPSATSNFA